jgi:DNA topoisomerase-1
MFNFEAPLATLTKSLWPCDRDLVSGKPVVAREGYFGPYVTDGETNASLTRGDRVEFVATERAFKLLAICREADPDAKKKAPSPRSRSRASTSQPVGD